MWSDPGSIVVLVACVAGVVAAAYGYFADRARRRDESKADFINTREYLGENRVQLTEAALGQTVDKVYPGLPRMLSKEEWVPDDPVPLSDLTLQLDFDTPPTPVHDEIIRLSARILPWEDSSSRYPNYGTALAALAPPKLLSDLPCYRLLSAELRSPNPVIRVAMTTFFQGINESEAFAHELARIARRSRTGGIGIPSKRLKVRSALPDPFSVAERNAIFSVSALSLRVEQEEASASFFLHSRDAKNVAIAGNLLHLAPSGVFQPTSDDRSTARRDCSPWLTLCREYAEEYLGLEEAQGEAGVALSYKHDEPYASINQAYLDGGIRVYLLGLGADPLTLCPELVTVSCIRSDVFDRVFSDLVTVNSEGFLRGKEMRSGGIVGYDFTDNSVQDLLTSGRLSPAASGALVRALKMRETIFAV